MKTIDKCIDMMKGIAIGDAYGAGYENLTQAQIQRKLIEGSYQKNPLYPDHFQGQYTDDTQMSLAVATLLYSPIEFSKENLAEEFVKAYQQDPRPVYSKRTLRALHGAQSGEEFVKLLNRQSKSNGSVMRSVPIGVFPEEEIQKLSTINSETTHRTSQAIDASMMVAYASHYFFHELGEARKVCDYVLEKMKNRNLMNTIHLQHIAGLKEFDSQVLYGQDHRDFGVPQDAIKTGGAVLYMLKHYGQEPDDLLRQSILLGGDVDTVASIALGISASRYGLEKISTELVEELEGGRWGQKHIRETAIRLASTLPMEIETVDRLNYPGKRQTMILNYMDGLKEVVEPAYAQQLMINLCAQVKGNIDYVAAIDATGFLPGVLASQILQLPMMTTKKAEINLENKIRFEEPSTAHPSIFAYAAPKESSRILIVDDEMQTGDTVYNFSEALSQRGHEVAGIVVPVEAKKHRARERFDTLGIPLYSHTQY